jgi:hypothetical protein
MDLSNLKKIDGIEDTQKQGLSFDVETGAESYTIELAYLGESSGGAAELNLTLKNGNAMLRQRVYMSSGRAKGQKPTYTNPQGKEVYLPGFIVASNLAEIVAGKELSELEQEEKVIKLWDRGEGKEVPTPVNALPELMGQEAIFAVRKIRENKNVNTGTQDAPNWEPSNEETFKNEIAQVFSEDTRSMKEIRDEVPADQATDLSKWVKNNTGKVKDNFKEIAGAPSADSGPVASGDAPKSLFS